MLKRLFFVSASILMLAIAYNLGARNVQAQAGDPVIVDIERTMAVAGNGDVYYCNDGLHDCWEHIGNVFNGNPGGDRVIALSFDGRFVALTASADVYESAFGNYALPWTRRGNVLGALTVQPETWTGVKTKYR